MKKLKTDIAKEIFVGMSSATSGDHVPDYNKMAVQSFNAAEKFVEVMVERNTDKDGHNAE